MFKWMKKIEKQTFYAFIALVVIDRLHGFFRFSLRYTDSDQTLLWQAAKDLSQGIFYTPCFYGQGYNPLFEPLFALPFMAIGLEVQNALPLVSFCLGIFPYFLLSYFLFQRHSPLAAMIPLAFLLLLPPEYAMLSALPRGFVAGIFFMFIGICILLYKQRTIALVLGGICMGLGLYANMNSLLLLPILAYSYSAEKWKIRSILLALCGFLLGISSIWLNGSYFESHPELLIHGAPNMRLSWDIFIGVFSKLSYYFDMVSPLFWRGGFITLALFPLVGYFLWNKGQKLKSLVSWGILLMLILSFSVSKVEDATNSVFFTGARMYLAYPLLLLWISLELYKQLSESAKERLLTGLILVSLLSFAVKQIAFQPFLQHALRGSAFSVVEVATIDGLQKTCSDLQRSGETSTELVLSLKGNSPSQLINYGCPCLIDSFPPTYQARYERRTWLKDSLLQHHYSPIIIHGIDEAWVRSCEEAGVQLTNYYPELTAASIHTNMPLDNLLELLPAIKD